MSNKSFSLNQFYGLDVQNRHATAYFKENVQRLAEQLGYMEFQLDEILQMTGEVNFFKDSGRLRIYGYNKGQGVQFDADKDAMLMGTFWKRETRRVQKKRF